MSPTIRQIPLVLALFALFFLSSTPATAWSLSCNDLCGAATEIQSYGTGSADLSCQDACTSGGGGACGSLWVDYLDCVDQGGSGLDCAVDYRAARKCSTCEEGEVAPWSPADVIFVNEPSCIPNLIPSTPPTYVPAGTYNDPLCSFHEGLDRAIDRQLNGRDTKVLVCEGTYRESYSGFEGRKVGFSGTTAKVVVEAVNRGEAVISGSDDWSGAWLPQVQNVTVDVHNELLWSTDLTSSPWTPAWVNVVPVSALKPPPVASEPGSVVEISPINNSGLTDPLYLYQNIPHLGQRQVTFSVYLKPVRAERFRLEFLRTDGNNPSAQQVGGAWFSFSLPPGEPCSQEVASGAEGYGIEEVDGGWYRVYLTQAMDTHPNPGSPAYGLTEVRLHLAGPLLAGEAVQVFAPQLDHRPLDQFAVTPRHYLPTLQLTDSKSFTTQHTFYLNDGTQKTWTHDWGLARHDALWGEMHPIMRRSEMVFVDSDPLRQELSIEDMEPGSFLVEDGVSYGGYNYKNDNSWVDGQCSATSPCTIRILPPQGVSLPSVPVEVATAPRLLWLNELENWTFNGLHFQHATGARDSDQQGNCPTKSEDCNYPLNSGALSLLNTQGLTLVENRVDWNGAHGWGLGGLGPLTPSAMVLRGNVLADNGIGGEFIGAARGFSVEGEQLLRNNWRGRRIFKMGHAATGAKYGGLVAGIFRNVTASYNYGSGLWFDYENQGVTVLDSTMVGNAANGIYFEANDAWQTPLPNPTSFVVGCHLEGNEVGVKGISSSDIRLSENLFLRNGTALSLDGTPRIEPNNLPLKYLRHWYITVNHFDAACDQNLWIQYGDGQGPTDYTDWWPVMDSMMSNDNLFSHPQGFEVEAIDLKGHISTQLDFTDWVKCNLSSDPWCILPQDGSSSFLP